MKVSEFTFDSSTAHNKIFTRLYEPDGEPEGYFADFARHGGA